MINLLPPKYKENLLSEEAKRLIIILGSLVFISLLSFSLISSVSAIVSPQEFRRNNIPANRVGEGFGLALKRRPAFAETLRAGRLKSPLPMREKVTCSFTYAKFYNYKY